MSSCSDVYEIIRRTGGKRNGMKQHKLTTDASETSAANKARANLYPKRQKCMLNS